MNFACKEISISDEDLGCTVTLSEHEEEMDFENPNTDYDIMHDTGKYVMLQRTYGKDEIEEDYHYYETNDPDKSGPLDAFKIILSETEFLLTIENEKYEIQIQPDNEVFEELKIALQKIATAKGELRIQ